jgi:carboxypeptidase C (cathepsin A)
MMSRAAAGCVAALTALGILVSIARESPAQPATTTPAAPGPQSSSATSPAASGEPARAGQQTPSPTRARLQDDVTREFSIDIGGRALQFSATAGSIPIVDAGDGSLRARIAYIAYAQPESPGRPVTFVFNGGPGAASTYLHLGALGPWRLPFANVTPSTPPVLVPNAQTWLDFTDLVFVDPPGTGYSVLTVSGDDARRQFWSVDSDAESLAVFVRKWVEKAGRQTSPKFIVGESYGGFRAVRMARVLQDSQQVGIAGLVLISPVLDFGWRSQPRHAPFTWVGRLPSMAAAARELDGAPFDRSALRAAEQYAAGDYLRDLLQGERDTAAIVRVSERVAQFTRLDLALVRQLGGRVDPETFEREIRRARGTVASNYDATVMALDPSPYSATSRYNDAMLGALNAPLAAAITDFYRTKFDWKIEAPYYLQNNEVNARWDWGRGRSQPQVVDDLRRAVAIDPKLRVLVAHGASDLVTPYFENQLILQQLPDYGAPERVKLSVYGGGHMFYSRDDSRRQFKSDAQALFEAAMAANGTPRN